jgi:proline dehydrogenase
MIDQGTPKAHLSFDNTEIAFRYKNDQELFRAAFIFSVVNIAWISALATGLVRAGIKLRLPITGLIRSTVFKHFCGGETMQESLQTAERLGAYGVQTILDYSVEGENSEADFEQACVAIINIFDLAAKTPYVPFCVFKMTAIADAAVLAKLNSGETLTPDEQESFMRSKVRVQRICTKAQETNIPVLIDAEESWIQGPIHTLAVEMMQLFNREKCLVYNTYQMYRNDMRARLEADFNQAKVNGYLMGVKLVRGAYIEKERERAASMDYPDPIHPTKQDTNNAFDEAMEFCVRMPGIRLVCGSHNEASNMKLTRLMDTHQISPSDNRIWFSQLLGMSDHISFNLSNLGYQVVKYVPFGPVRSVMPYLIRRAEENTSVAGQSSRELVLIRREIQRRKSLRRKA